MNEILEELKKINHALEIQSRMLETLIESDSQKNYEQQVSKHEATNHVEQIFTVLKQNPLFKDNPEILNMVSQLTNFNDEHTHTESEILDIGTHEHKRFFYK